MAYLTLNDVRSAIPQVPITATSKPSEGQVDEFIETVEGIVDAVLTGIGYTTPVTGDYALRIVREIVMAGVLAKVLNTRDLGVRDPETSGGAHQQRRFDRLLEQLETRSDPLHLKDANPTTTKPKVFARGTATTEAAEDIEPVFTRADEY